MSMMEATDAGHNRRYSLVPERKVVIARKILWLPLLVKCQRWKCTFLFSPIRDLYYLMCESILTFMCEPVVESEVLK